MMNIHSVAHIARNVGEIACIRADETIVTAARRLRERKVGCLVVLDAEGKVTGIVTERDIVIRAVAESDDFHTCPVGEIMTRNAITCTLETPITSAQELMAARHIRHLPIVRDGKPVAMLSSRDIVAHQILATKALQAAAEQVAKLSKGFKNLDYDEILDLVTHDVPRILGADYGALCLSGGGGGTRNPQVVSRVGCVCPEITLPEGLSEDPLGCITLHELPESCARCGGTSPRTVFHLPIYGISEGDNDGEQQAYLCMCRLKSTTAESKELLSYKASLLQEILSVNLMNARLYERARRNSRIDPLTKVQTRRVFEEELQQEYERAVRYEHQFCVSIIDVDNFKSVNDRCGHVVGDQTLRILGGMMQRQVRSTDVLARYGGDEFVILMPETRLDDARVVVERLRASVEVALGRNDQPITVSCGVAEWLGDAADTGTDVLQRADTALYRAKNTGRNRVVASSVEAIAT